MAAKQLWLISDTHFNHANIIRYSDRPFKDPAEMNEVMIEKWNAKVKPRDHIYHLGDVYMGDKANIGTVLARLHGHKRLILGNHDDLNDNVLHRYFDKIMMWRIFREEKLMLSHVPVHPASLKEKYDLRNIHGHIHEQQLPDERYRCICVEHTDYEPIPIEEAYNWVSKRVVNKEVITGEVGKDRYAVSQAP